MNTIARDLEAEARSVRRLVESPRFKEACSNGCPDDLIIKGDIIGLKAWLSGHSPSYKQLRDRAKFNGIPNYSRMSKVQLGTELARINEPATEHNEASTPRGWSILKTSIHRTKGI